MGRPISQQPVFVGTFVPSAQTIQAVPVPAGYPVYDQSFPRAPFQPQADFFNTFSSFTVLILGISKSGGDPPPLHKMWGRG